MSPNSQVFRNRHLQSGSVMGRDYISNMPNDIASRILYRLTTREAVQSSVLSKEWRRKWHLVYHFELDDRWFNNVEGESFLDFMERTFPHLQNAVGLKLRSQETYNFNCISACLHAFLVGKAIQYFEYENLSEGAIFLPPGLLSCTSLRHLILRWCFFFKLPNQNRLPNLRRLCLFRVLFQNGNPSNDKVFFTLPLVENIDLSQCVWLNIKFIEIYAPKLIDFQSVTVEEVPYVGNHSIRIHDAKIQKFCIRGGCPESIELPTSTVVFVALNNDPGKNDTETLIPCGLKARKLLGNLSAIKELHLRGFSAEAIAIAKDGLPLPKFRTLVKLYMDSYIHVEGLLLLLHASPCLKFLGLEADAEYEWDDYNYDVEVPSCVVSHLESVKFRHFLCSESEYGLIKLIVENGAVLKRFSIACFERKDKEIMARISTFRRASSCLEFEM